MKRSVLVLVLVAVCLVVPSWQGQVFSSEQHEAEGVLPMSGSSLRGTDEEGTDDSGHNGRVGPPMGGSDQVDSGPTTTGEPIGEDISGAPDGSDPDTATAVGLPQEPLAEAGPPPPSEYSAFVNNVKECYSDEAALPIQALLRVYAENTNVNTFHACQITAHNVWTGYISGFYAANYNPGLFFMDPTNGGRGADGCTQEVVGSFFKENERLLALAGLLHDAGKTGNYDPILGSEQCMHKDMNMISRCPEKTSKGYRTVAGHPMDSFLMCMGHSDLYVTEWAKADSALAKYYAPATADKHTCLKDFPTPDNVYRFDFGRFFADLSLTAEQRELVCLLTGMHYTFGDVNKASYGGQDSIDPEAYTLGAEKMKNEAAVKKFRASETEFIHDSTGGPNSGKPEWARRSQGMRLRLEGFLELTPALKASYGNYEAGLAKLAMLSNVIGYADVAAAAQKEPYEAVAYYNGALPLGLAPCMWLRTPELKNLKHDSKLVGRFGMRAGVTPVDYRSSDSPITGETSTEFIFSKYDFSGACVAKESGDPDQSENEDTTTGEPIGEDMSGAPDGSDPDTATAVGLPREPLAEAGSDPSEVPPESGDYSDNDFPGFS